MTERLSCLLAVAAACAFTLAATAQSRLSGPVPQPPRVSHVPVVGGVSQDMADRFLDQRLQEAHIEAELQKRLNELADNPDKFGVPREDQKRLREALDRAQRQPEQALNDPTVREVLGKIAREQQGKTSLSPEENERLKELIRRYGEQPPSETEPSDPTKPPSDPATGPKPIDPGRPPAPVPPPGPPPAPPAPPPPPEKSVMKDGLRGVAEAVADSPLAASPAFRRMVASLDRVKAPQAPGAIDWDKLAERFARHLGDAGQHLPNVSWPKIDWSAHAGRGAGRDVSVPSAEGAGAGRALLLLLAVATAGLLAWGLLRGRGAVLLGRAASGWRLGPWPVRPEAVRTREELVLAFEYLALLLLGPAARSHNHRDIATEIGADDDARRAAAERLAGLYEQARYAPPDEALPDADLEAARAALSLLAGAAAA